MRVFSFSFHRSLPKDESGHGGGFVFDCRALPNPGREERFKSLTGKDAAVIEYLNREESVHQFLAGAMSLVDASVNTYQGRGFKNLMVSFGCTGGQHRSVFMAEQLARHLRSKAGRQAALLAAVIVLVTTRFLRPGVPILVAALAILVGLREPSTAAEERPS